MQGILNPVFAGLSDILEVKHFRDEEDGACFATLQQVFTRYGMCDRFAVTLLHTHFPVFQNEVLIESPDLEERIVITEVALSRDVGCVSCSWRLMEKNSGEHEFVPNQYVALSPQFEGAGFHLTSIDNEFFTAVATTLKTHNAERRFGLRFQFPFLRPRLGEYVLERTDPDNRILEFTFENESDFDPASSIETTWVFVPITESLRRSIPMLRSLWLCNTRTILC